MCEDNEWFEEKLKLVDENKEYSVYEYDCNGIGEVITYRIFDGIEIVFMNFNTYDTFILEKLEDDIIEISLCKKGWVECEFKNKTVSYLQEGSLGINGNKYIPSSYEFPIGIYEAVTIVINKNKCTKEVKDIFKNFSIDLDCLFEDFNLDKAWYINRSDYTSKRIFEEIYIAKKNEGKNYFSIKCLELVYHIARISKFSGKDIVYYKKEYVYKVKKIRDCLISSLDEKVNIEKCVLKEGMGLTTFRNIFSQIYGYSPITYLTKYKMAMATKLLSDRDLSITTIAMKLGYSNPSKFSATFKKEYGILPKDYRKNN